QLLLQFVPVQGADDGHHRQQRQEQHQGADAVVEQEDEPGPLPFHKPELADEKVHGDDDELKEQEKLQQIQRDEGAQKGRLQQQQQQQETFDPLRQVNGAQRHHAAEDDGQENERHGQPVHADRVPEDEAVAAHHAGQRNRKPRRR